MKNLLLILLILVQFNIDAQDIAKVNPLKFSGYIETYYSYDFNNPESHERPSFFYNFNRHNEVNLNVGMIKASYKTDNVRGNLAFMTGTYAQYNLSGEQGLLKNVYEANVGVKISKSKNIWVDAGVMPSHIGFESAIGKECLTLTRSLLAENSPYYESGVKLSYVSENKKLNLSAMYLNGWQRIQRISANQTPSFGTQVTYMPNSNISLNWSTYVGSEQPDSLKQMRYFNNFYVECEITKKLGLIAGFDIGMQQMKKDTSAYNNWYSTILIVQYKPTEKTRIAARGEYYADEKGVIVATGTPNGFKTTGYSLNFDYLLTENVMWRLEGRGLNSKDQIFVKSNKPTSDNYFITTSLSIMF